MGKWVSPDITIIQPGGARGTEAVADQQNQVEIVVTNAGGIEAVDAYIDVFYADPSTTFTPATATLINGAFLTIPGYSTRAISFSWVPGESDEGHRCLAARAALYLPPDVYADGTIFDVRGDRHVAQRNINVVSLGDSDALGFSFAIVNPFRKASQMRVIANEVRELKALNHLRQSLGCQFAQFGETPLRPVRLGLTNERIFAEVKENPLELLDTAHRLSRKGVITIPRPDRTGNSLTVDMKAGEIREAVLYIVRNPKTRAGDLHAVNVAQKDPDGSLIGGLTLLIQH